MSSESSHEEETQAERELRVAEFQAQRTIKLKNKLKDLQEFLVQNFVSSRERAIVVRYLEDAEVWTAKLN